MNWKSEKLGALISESRIPANNPDPDRRIRVKLNVLGVEKRPFEYEVAGATKQFQRKAGQFIYGKQNFHKGAFGIIPDELDGFETSADIPSFDVREDCLPEWIFYYFKVGNRYLEMVKYARGVGSKRIHPEQIAEIDIPLPSIKEQRLLIDRFKKIEEDSQNISNEFENQETLLTQLRQSFLREAMQGKLVKQDPKDGHAKELLDKIKAEKAKSGKKEKELPPIKPEEIPFEIPENWVWCRLGDVGINRDGSRVPLSMAERLFKQGEFDYYGAQGVIDHINDYKFDGTYLLIAEDGQNLLRKNKHVAFIASGKFWVNNHAHVNDFYNDSTREFVKSYINSINLKPFISGKPPSQIKLKRSQLDLIPTPLPPLSEQTRIIAKLDELMKLCDDLQQSIQDSREQNELLSQQVLKEILNL